MNEETIKYAATFRHMIDMKIKKIFNIIIVHFCVPKNEPKRAAVHLVSQRLTTLRSLKRTDASESRFAPPNRFSVLFCAAWLREMAFYKNIKYFFVTLFCLRQV